MRSFLLFSVLLLCSVAVAQEGPPTAKSGTPYLFHLSGTVVDSSGALVSGASVSLKGTEGAERLSVRTNKEGAFTIADLPAGSYRLIVSMQGFETKEIQVTIGAQAPPSLRISLSVSPVISNVVVTATRSEEEIERQPASVSVVALEDIQNRNVQTVDESLDLVPGLLTTRDKGLSDTMPATFLRGFYGPERTLVLLDGQPLNDPLYGGVTWSSLPIDEVQSVEVVRGPFSSLYGGNALGGVVNVQTRPVAHRELDLYSEYGSHESTRNSVSFTDRFFEKLGVSLNYQRFQFGGYPTVPIVAYSCSPYCPSGPAPVVTGAIPTLDPYANQAFVIGDGGRNWANTQSFYIKGEFAPTNATVLKVMYLRQEYNYGYKMYDSFLKDTTGATVDNGTFSASYNGVPQEISVSPFNFLQDDGNQHSHFIAASLFHKFVGAGMLRMDGSMYYTPNNS